MLGQLNIYTKDTAEQAAKIRPFAGLLSDLYI